MVSQINKCMQPLNTSTPGLIQAARKKTAGLHVALRGNFSAPVWVTNLVEVLKTRHVL